MKYVIKEVNDKAQANNISSSSNGSSHTPINIFAFSLLDHLFDITMATQNLLYCLDMH